ncbi:MAG: hypothetical protein IJA52_05380 [Clostridia bacterium]|nr:hypothetical protein [Clostridia bacterium]
MADLKDNWKEAGKGLGHAFRDLGKAAVKTAKVGIKKVDEWANGSDEESKPEEKKD